LGIELMNEPPPSSLDVFGFSTRDLYPFYRRIVQAVTGVRDGMQTCPATHPVQTGCAFPDLGIHDRRHMIFVDPMALRNEVDRDLGWGLKPFTSYDNIVFAPHTYTNSFTVSLLHHSLVRSYAQSLDTAWVTAKHLNASVFVTEFGGSSSKPQRIRNIIEEQDRHLTSSTHWVWKERGEWDLWKQNGSAAGLSLRPEMVQILSRARPIAVSGQLLAVTYDVETGDLTIEATKPVGPSLPPPTLIYFPPHVAPNVTLQTVRAVGANIQALRRDPDGSATLELQPELAGARGATYSLATATTEQLEKYAQGDERGMRESVMLV